MGFFNLISNPLWYEAGGFVPDRAFLKRVFRYKRGRKMRTREGNRLDFVMEYSRLSKGNPRG